MVWRHSSFAYPELARLRSWPVKDFRQLVLWDPLWPIQCRAIQRRALDTLRYLRDLAAPWKEKKLLKFPIIGIIYNLPSSIIHPLQLIHNSEIIYHCGRSSIKQSRATVKNNTKPTTKISCNKFSGCRYYFSQIIKSNYRINYIV